MKKLICTFLSILVFFPQLTQAQWCHSSHVSVHYWTPEKGPIGRFVVSAMAAELSEEHQPGELGLIFLLGKTKTDVITVEASTVGDVGYGMLINLAITSFDGSRKLYPITNEMNEFELEINMLDESNADHYHALHDSIQKTVLHALWRYQELGILQPDQLMPTYYSIRPVSIATEEHERTSGGLMVKDPDSEVVLTWHHLAIQATCNCYYTWEFTAHNLPEEGM